MATEVEIERMVVRLIGDAESYKRMVKEGIEQTKKLERNIGKSMKRIGASMTRLGRRMTLTVTAPIIGLGVVAVREFAKFDQAMTESTSIMKVTQEQTERMRETALSLAGEGIQGPDKLAQSYFFLASAGKDAEQAMALLPVVQRFATAGAFDMALATDLLTDAQSALGLSSKNAQQDMVNMTMLSDKLVGANTLANASVQQFSTALTSKAGAAIKSYNIDLNEGIALLAAYADQGIKAELAGNAFDRVVRLLTKAQADNAKEFEKLNVTIFDAEGEFRTFEQIIGDIERATEGLSTKQKAATLTMLGFEARVQSVILPLLGTSAAIGDYVDKLDKMDGVTKRVADKQLKSFSNQLTILKNKFKVAGVELGESLIPLVKDLTNLLDDGLRTWKGYSVETKRAVVQWLAAAAVIGPLLIVLGILASSIGSLIGLYNTLTGSVIASSIATRVGATRLKVYGVAAVVLTGLLLAAAKAQLELNAAITEGNRLADLSSKRVDRETKRIIGEAGDPALGKEGRDKFFRQEIRKANQAVLDAERDKNKVEAELAQVKNVGGFRGFARGIGPVFGIEDARIKETQSRVDKANQKLKDNKRQLKALKEEADRVIKEEAGKTIKDSGVEEMIELANKDIDIRVRFSIEGVEAVAAGSARALAHIQGFKDFSFQQRRSLDRPSVVPNIGANQGSMMDNPEVVKGINRLVQLAEDSAGGKQVTITEIESIL